MSIVIKEIILSDNLEKFMEKVNFNFDQLMLAGGGPAGPIGPIGLPGPAGPQGDPGNKWYVGCTGTSAGLPPLFEGDLYLMNGNPPCAGGSPLGQVYEWDAATETFLDTFTNLRGPTGPSGATGANTGWVERRGTTSLSNQWTIDTLGLGPTSNFTLMSGDDSTFWSNAGTSAGYSRDTLWLGGQLSSLILNSQWSLDREPKLYVSPRTPITTSVFWNNDGLFGGLAGGGIALGWEPTSPWATATYNEGGQDQSHSMSNIFVDSSKHLHITNYTNFLLSQQVSQSENAIFISSTTYSSLSGADYRPDYTLGGVFAGQGIWDHAGGTAYTTPTGGGVLIKARGKDVAGIDNLGAMVIRNEISYAGQFQVYGGGNNLNSANSAFYGNETFDDFLTGANNVYRILITNEDINLGTNQSEIPFISGGNVDTDSRYIGISSTGQSNDSRGSFFANQDRILIGDFTDFDATYLTNPSHSLDVVGRIRMRDSGGTAGYVMTSSDAFGTGIWTDPIDVGVWKPDPSCDFRIVVSDDNTWASTFNSTNVGYSRFDFAINDTPDATTFC